MCGISLRNPSYLIQWSSVCFGGTQSDKAGFAYETIGFAIANHITVVNISWLIRSTIYNQDYAWLIYHNGINKCWYEIVAFDVGFVNK